MGNFVAANTVWINTMSSQLNKHVFIELQSTVKQYNADSGQEDHNNVQWQYVLGRGLVKIVAKVTLDVAKLSQGNKAESTAQILQQQRV